MKNNRLLIIILIVIAFLGIGSGLLFVIYNNQETKTNKIEREEDDDKGNSFILDFDKKIKVKDIVSYKAPNNFVDSNDSGNTSRISMRYNSDDIRCGFSLYVLASYKTYEEYIASVKDTFNCSELGKKTVNDITWKVVYIDYGISHEKNYVTTYKNKLFVYMFASSKDNDCTSYEEEILKSIKLK